jgi:DNA topoisomerase-1
MRLGAKQYRYHPRYREVRDQTKFSRMIAFGTVLAIIRRRVQQDVMQPGLPKQKVLATALQAIRILPSITKCWRTVSLLTQCRCP